MSIPKTLTILAVLLTTLSIITPLTLTKVQAQEAADAACITCHSRVTPGVVIQYIEGAMGKPGIQNPLIAKRLGGLDTVSCIVCHGSDHTSEDDWEEAKLPDQNTCKICHPDKVEEYLAGKHSLAWKAMMAIPMVKEMPKEEVLYGCGGCHKIGVKDPQDLLDLGLTRPYGIGATCDQCHTRHSFNTTEARMPEACSKCHMGFDHPQWEMWSTSKHGNIYFANKDKYPFNVSLKFVRPYEYPGPTCQLCHMPDGTHNVLTSWGFLALVAFEGRPEGLTVVEDPEWEAAKAEILKALRVLDPQGNPTPLLDTVTQLKMVRTDPYEFIVARDRLLEVCSDCHSRNFALQYLTAADRVVRETTIQLAEAIKAVKEAREQGIYPPRPGEPDNPYPFLLNFYEEPSSVDREVWLMFLEYRMRAFQGMFHVNPDYTHWYGWSEMRRAMGDILEDIDEAKEAKQVGEAVSQLNTTVESVEANLGSLEDRVTSIEGRVETVEGATSKIEGRVSKVESETGRLDSAVSQLQDSVGKLRSSVETLKSELKDTAGKATAAMALGGFAVIVAAAFFTYVARKR